jgi:HEAT repeat protein
MTTELVDLLKIAQAENQLMDLGRSDVPSVRRAAFDALGQLRQPDGIALLVRALGSSSDWIDRVTAAKALCYSRTPEGARALTVALRDSEDLVAIEAARSLAIRAEKSAVGELLARRDAARAADNLRLAAAFGAAAKAIEGAK